MANDLLGEWRLISSENFDSVMKKLGVGYLQRKLGNTLKPNVRIEQNSAGKWTVTTISSFKTHATSFELNKEFDEETIDGRHLKSTVVIEGGKMITTQKDNSGNVVCIITREINDKGEHVTYVKADDLVCTRVYQKA